MLGSPRVRVSASVSIAVLNSRCASRRTAEPANGGRLALGGFGVQAAGDAFGRQFVDGLRPPADFAVLALDHDARLEQRPHVVIKPVGRSDQLGRQLAN